MSKPTRKKPIVKHTADGGIIVNLRALLSVNVIRTFEKLVNDIFVATSEKKMSGFEYITNYLTRQDYNTQVLRGYVKIMNTFAQSVNSHMSDFMFDVLVTKHRSCDVQLEKIERIEYDIDHPFLTTKQPNAIELPRIELKEYMGPVYVISTLVRQETNWRTPENEVLFSGPDLPLLEIGIIAACPGSYTHPSHINVRKLGIARQSYSRNIYTGTHIHINDTRPFFWEHIIYHKNKSLGDDVEIIKESSVSEEYRRTKHMSEDDSNTAEDN